MKTLFAATVALGLSSAAAPAQQGPQTFGTPQNGDTLLWHDDTVSIVATDSARERANHYEILCPDHPGRRYYTPTDGALVNLFNLQREYVETNLMVNQRADTALRQQYDPTQNLGFIGPDNTLTPAYNIAEEIEHQEKLLAAPGEIPGSDPRQAVLIEKLRVHAQKFCFGRF